MYSVLLIDDHVLSDIGAELRAAEMNILVWLHKYGLDRTGSQWRHHFDSFGLELIGIWNSDGERSQSSKREGGGTRFKSLEVRKQVSSIDSSVYATV